MSPLLQGLLVGAPRAGHVYRGLLRHCAHTNQLWGRDELHLDWGVVHGLHFDWGVADGLHLDWGVADGLHLDWGVDDGAWTELSLQLSGLL
eukprot:2561512-Amphidinium_carterae.1